MKTKKSKQPLFNKIKDIEFDPCFFDDWDRVPDAIRTKFNNKIEMMSYQLKTEGLCSLPNSFQHHPARNKDEYTWIGYVSVGKAAWRVLMNIDVHGVIHFERILPHSKRDAYLRKFYS
jgi:mRNA-degrading endonuclease RelE of RelBE toxin-antitoxin system